MDSIEHAFGDFADICSQLALAWYVFGAQAINLYGVPRTTADIDVTIELPPNLEDFIDALTDRGFEIRVEEPLAFIAQTSVLPVVHSATSTPVDVVFAQSGIESLFLSRSRQVPVASGMIPVIAPEDLIVSKVLAGRTKDIEDAERIYRSTDVDRDEILRLLESLEEALDRLDLVRVFLDW